MAAFFRKRCETSLAQRMRAAKRNWFFTATLVVVCLLGGLLTPPAAMGSDDNTESEKNRKGLFTAYTSRESETEGDPYLTADETDLREFSGCVVANNELPFGTKIEIDGVGTCEVRDRMADQYDGDRFDIYMGRDVEGAKEFEQQELYYSIVEKPKADK